LDTQNSKETFVATQKNSQGDITAFKTSKNRELSYEDALNEVKAGNIQGVNLFRGKDDDMYIRGNADGDPTNNLDNLPIFD
jgi:hypothetical protein